MGFLVILKDISIRGKRVHREGIISCINSFQIITTMVFCFLIALCIIVLGLFISDRMKKILLSREDYFYILPDQNNSLMIPSDDRKLSSFSSLSFEDWVAPPENLWHSMSDEELIWRASMAPNVAEYPYNRTPKVAFMFLARGRLPLGPLWERFFKGHDPRLYSIYLHCSPEFTEERPESSVFYKRRIPSKVVEWGKASMIDAERRLLANALLDFSNERFVLLSETCIPLFDFITIYKFLVSSKYSFISSFDDPRPIGRGRYNKRMWPTLSISDWRKGSQWFETQRKIAIGLISDRKYYPVFVTHCKPPCYMDEHYMATLVNKQNPEMNSNTSITWVDWTTGGSHPKTFLRRDISETFLNQIRFDSGNCNYTGNNSSSYSYCFLFARKFHPSTLEPLLRITPKLFGFDPKEYTKL
ncbi:hypothetical protein MKX03_008855 [Papaver bracteatum]|nr:hypothetical protein MKX03_008855 [Papaver bracteatum]